MIMRPYIEDHCLSLTWVAFNHMFDCSINENLFTTMDGSAFCRQNVQNSSLLLFYRFLFISGSTAHKLAHKQKTHVLLYKVGQSLLCAL